MAKSQKQKVIVRTYSAGVHYGTLVERNGKEVILADAKRIWRWHGAWTLNEIATKGVSKESKISCAVPSVTLTEAIEVFTCTDEAAKVLDGAEWAS